MFEELGRVLYDGPFVLNEVAAQPGDEVWSIEIDGFVPHLASVGRVLLPGMQAATAQGESVTTMDETLRLGKLAANGSEAAAGEWDDVRRRLLAALALEAVGIGAKALELAIAYASEREQFGKQIGVYQAISHSLVDGYVAVELGRSLAYWAAWCVAEGDADTDLAVAAAKSQATEAAVLACEKSIQALGGIGFTWEHPLHRYYKRALWLEGALGYGREHRARGGAIPSVFITGASTGIGRATAELLRRPRLGRLRDRPPAGRCADRDARARPRRHRPAAVGRAAAGIEELDALVDNAGIGIAGPLEVLPLDELSRQLDVNVVGQLRVTAGAAARPPPPARPHRDDGLDLGPLSAAVPRRVRDEQVRARGDGRCASQSSSHPGESTSRSSSRARSRRRSGRSRSVRPPTSRRRPPSSTASGWTGSGASPRSALRRHAVPAVDVAKAVEQRASRPSSRRRATSSGPTPRRRARVQKLPDRLRDRVLTRFLFGS